MTLFRRYALLLALAALALASTPLVAQSSGVAMTPPMGWNSWNHFHRNVTDAVIRAEADAMVKSGMRDAGYTYINIDDTWEGERDAQGNIQTNSKFPDMKALADYVHSKGLKLGIYSSPGAKTCAGFEGSLGHEEQDARTYAAWGIDYLKYDLCGLRVQMRAAGSHEAAHKVMVDAYVKMRDALRSTGRPMVYSLCQYGVDDVWEWGASVGGNLWRTTGDINDTYERMADIGFNQIGIGQYAGPGHWNDPDMLEVGNGGMTADEYKTHMSLWAILAAPLLAGNDLATMTPETLAILTNRDVIAVDQDKLGKQGDRIDADGAVEIWAKPLADGSKAVGIFNRQTTPQTAHVDFGRAGFTGAVKARDLWLHKDLGSISSPYNVTVPAHGVVMLRVWQ
ncbi:glycoside hydrolase family 27 protein [Edaphobacter sp.]|uniref:glycoside hydrolase family 27 protein n=1 Tax=Edaphobacter sp. TaxID=1934404 RepID=UPI002DBFD899|nr:glycoside hydrolase family 27 protein [Edaphobacter sp.]HEU5342058.1 glycoside hydrolase family 27 protein [Edaphobacter sp.]